MDDLSLKTYTIIKNNLEFDINKLETELKRKREALELINEQVKKKL